MWIKGGSEVLDLKQNSATMQAMFTGKLEKRSKEKHSAILWPTMLGI